MTRALAAVLLLGLVTSTPAGPVPDEIERNWGRQGRASQSSTALGADAGRAIDGNADGNWAAGSVTHTAQEAEPYWQVDLGAAHYVDEIRIHNRTDCCGERLKDLVVFWANNRTGFKARDIATLLTENSGSDPSTAVYSKPVFGLAGDVDPATGARSAVTTIHLVPADCNTSFGDGCLMRFVRIQLAGNGPLSLAEVEVVEKARINGPAVVDDAVTWAPTGLGVQGEVAMAAQGERLFTYFRGADKLVHGSLDFGADVALAGSPTVTAGAPAAVVLPLGRGIPGVIPRSKTSTGFVAVQTAAGALAVAEGTVGDEPLAAPTWSTLGTATAPPAMVTGCGRVVVAWRDGPRVYARWKAIGTAAGPAGWTGGRATMEPTETAPTLATNNRGEVGLAYLGPGGTVQVMTLSCDPAGGAPSWSGPVQVVGTATGRWASLAAYGPHFLVATQGNDERGYVAMQRTVGTAEEWQGPEPIPGSMRGDPGLPLREPPLIFVMSGAIIAAARERQTGELLAWLKLPNRMTPGDPWMGGRPVGGGGVGATPPVLASLGHSALAGMSGAPAELYVAMVGGPDRRVRAMNLGRWLALDILHQDLALNVIGLVDDKGQQAVREPDLTLGSNLLEQLLAVLSLPAGARPAVLGHLCGRLTLATNLTLDRNHPTGNFLPGCPATVNQGTEVHAASGLMHEWLHDDAWSRSLGSLPGWGAAFPWSATSMVPEASGMRACQVDPDCGTDLCQRAGDGTGGQSSTRDFDAGETELRRWDNVLVCVSPTGPWGRRPQGGLAFYDVGTFDHAFIAAAIAYRWHGEDLRAAAQQDAANGNDLLQRRYDWLKANYFGGVEFSGRVAVARDRDRSDRALGWWGMPNR